MIGGPSWHRARIAALAPVEGLLRARPQDVYGQARHERLFEVAPDPQDQSSLFNVLPAEIRRLIWEFVLSDYPDFSGGNRYSLMTYYTRPDYEAPRKSDTRVLRTCRAVYVECWRLPFLLREHTWWLTSPDRHPADFSLSDAQNRLTWSLGYASHPFAMDSKDLTIKGLRVFAQMYMLEDGALERLLETPELHPQKITLTIRHADWWFWESDERLRFEADWLEDVASALSPHTCEFVVELETVSRKKAQLEHVAAHMTKNWFFRREDDVVLFGDTTGKSNKTSGWQGPSAWASKRWVRDECSPGKIDYCIISVPFRLRTVVERRGGEVNDGLETMAYEPERMRVTAPGEEIAEEGWVFCDTDGDLVQ